MRISQQEKEEVIAELVRDLENYQVDKIIKGFVLTVEYKTHYKTYTSENSGIELVSALHCNNLANSRYEP